MAAGNEPSLELAARVLPAPLLRALRHVFAQRLEGCMLVGGTALAGFYAGHRRSDDLDLFTQCGASQRAAALAVRSLKSIGGTLVPRQDSEVYIRALCRLDVHRFTVDVSTAPTAFHAGRFVVLEGGLAVADADLMLTLKAAALVSRCSEKDLYDLMWLLRHRPGLTLGGLVEAASKFDGGADAEGLLISLTGAKLDEESCGFGLKGSSNEEIFRQVSRFKTDVARGLRSLARDEPPPPLSELVARARRLKRRG